MQTGGRSRPRSITELCGALGSGPGSVLGSDALVARVQQTEAAVAALSQEMAATLVNLRRNISDRPTQKAVAVQLKSLDEDLATVLSAQNRQLREALQKKLDPQVVQDLLVSHNAARDQADAALEQRIQAAASNSAARVLASVDQRVTAASAVRDQAITALQEQLAGFAVDAATSEQVNGLLKSSKNYTNRQLHIALDTRKGANAALEGRVMQAQTAALATAVSDVNALLKEKLKEAQNVARSTGDAALNVKVKELNAARTASVAAVQSQVAQLVQAQAAGAANWNLKFANLQAAAAELAKGRNSNATAMSQIAMQHQKQLAAVRDEVVELRKQANAELAQLVSMLQTVSPGPPASFSSGQLSPSSSLLPPLPPLAPMWSLPTQQSLPPSSLPPSTAPSAQPSMSPKPSSLNPVSSLPAVAHQLSIAAAEGLDAAAGGATSGEVEQIIAPAVETAVVHADAANISPAPMVHNIVAKTAEGSGVSQAAHNIVQNAAKEVIQNSTQGTQGTLTAANYWKVVGDAGDVKFIRKDGTGKARGIKLIRTANKPSNLGDDGSAWAAKVALKP